MTGFLTAIGLLFALAIGAAVVHAGKHATIVAIEVSQYAV